MSTINRIVPTIHPYQARRLRSLGAKMVHLATRFCHGRIMSNPSSNHGIHKDRIGTLITAIESLLYYNGYNGL
jgi:hypothetical protein